MTVYEQTLKVNTERAIFALGHNQPQIAARIVDQELEVFDVYGVVGQDRPSWVIPLIDICRAISVLMDPVEPDAKSLMLTVWSYIAKRHEQFRKEHGL